uniref:Allophycocyanin gamma subunit n=1 Tax=Gronococcus sybilensis TaxID=3028029 RepID=A0A9Y1I2N8_9RHOD|nr:allophycocyanin gamma subunit [Gronococcus sybilensis]
MSLVSQIITQADDELRYPTSGELENIQYYLSTGERRFKVIKVLRDKEREIVTKASKKLFQIHPEYIGPGGNASGAKQRALCLRDYGWYLRLITYGILSGDKEPIEKIGVLGVRDMYNSLGVPMIGMIDSIFCLREATIAELENDRDEELIAPYFDFLVRGMS